MPIKSEDWEGVTPPAIPAGWTAGTGITTSAAAGGFTPTSGTVMLRYASGSNGVYFLTWNAADANAGNVSVRANLGAFSASSNQMRAAVCARGSSDPLTTSSTGYTGFIDWSTNTVGISKIVTGAETDLFTVTPSSLSQSPYWYQIELICNGPALSLSLQRLADLYWLDGSGNWGAGQATAVSGSDAVVTGAGYTGIRVDQVGAAIDLFSDDLVFSSLGPVVPIPRPLIVSFPHQYYPHFSE